MEGDRRRDLPSRVPAELCRSSRLEIGIQRVPVLRAGEGPALSITGRTRLVAILSDSGTWIEVVHAENLGRYLMLFHQIGSTAVLGGYDGVPSDRQIAALLQGAQSDASRVRAAVRLTGDGNTELQLIQPSQPAGQEAPSREPEV
jgi:hypothetical protein